MVQRRFLLSWQWVVVSGDSMTPTLLPGDRVLVDHAARPVVGSIVLARFASRPELLVVKRAAQPRDGRWWVLSDNRRAGTDSRTLGTAEVVAVARWRIPGATARTVAARRGWGPWARWRWQRLQPDVVVDL